MTVITVVITLLYPLLIWLAHGHIEPKWLAALLLLAVLTRVFSLTGSLKDGSKNSTLMSSRVSLVVLIVVLLLAVAAIWSNGVLPLKLYPVLVNVGLLAVFGASLFTPVSMVERFARITEPELPPVAVAYTRRVTQLWCGFFICNGTLALVAAIWASEALWSLYTGVISYLLMGLLFGCEYIYRLRFKRRQHE